MFFGQPARAQASAAELTNALSLERIHADPPLAGRQPRQAQLSPGGRWLSYLQPSEADSEVLELWARPLPSGPARRLASVQDLIGAQAVRLSEAEKMALERRRVRGTGITSYQWCGREDQGLIVPLSGALYLIDLRDGAARTRRIVEAGAAPAREPQCDRAGAQLAFVRGGNLFVQSLSGAPLRQLSRGGSETHSMGLAEFIAEEELGRHQGLWWSRDGSRLLAIEVDESAVPIKTRAQIFADRTEMTAQRYPAAGERNATLRAWVFDPRSGKRQALAQPAGSEYLARAGWLRDGTPWVQWLSRDQRQLSVLLYEGAELRPRTVLEEQDEAWVELHSDLRELPARELSGKPALLWSSERSGVRQYWLLDRVTGSLQPLTQQAEPVSHLVCAARERIVFAGATERGRGRELFETDLQGRTRQLQPGAAQRWRDAQGDEACRQMLVTRSQWGQPPVMELQPLDGDAPAEPLLAEAPDPLLAVVAPQVQALDLLAADGETRLNAFYLPPLTARPAAQRHPLIVRAYGGPGASTVGWRWDADTPMLAYLQRQGFGILMLDTRGMANRDRAFTRAHRRAFGRMEVADLFAAVRQLPALVPGVDPARIGFRGWSYGGYLAARSMLDPKSPFAAAIGIAAPTDWTLYDSAYTERYLGLPEGGQAAAYQQANLLPRAKWLSKPLMLVHGTADDNVLFEHSLRLISALQNEGKLFETVIYPGKAHGIAGRAARLHLARTETDFFIRHLKP